jgi:alkane 1-monooxygenase
MAQMIGYTLIFAPLVLLVVGSETHSNYLLPAFFFLGLPALRLLFGSPKEGGYRDWRPWQRRVLAWIPRLYVAAFLATIAWAFTGHPTDPSSSTGDRLLFAISLLVMCGLASCVAHELSHRSNRWDRRLALVTTAVAGYPFFVYEHGAHHLDPRSTDRSNCPRRDESVWRYCARRMFHAPVLAFEACARRRRSGRTSTWLDSQWLYLVLTILIWIGVTARGGEEGALTYGLLVLGVPFLLNAITYIQHWGLGREGADATGGAEQIGWDETSRVQAWLILGISFHDQHHREPGRPYFEYGPTHGAPRLPADYAVMFLLCLVPPLWSAVMDRHVDAWEKAPRPR